MKKRHFYGLALITAAIIFLAWSKGEKNTAIKEEISAPEKLISIDKAKSLYANYHENRISLIKDYERMTNNNENFTAVEYVEWNIETIENYLKYIRQEAHKANTKVETIRIYLGQYEYESENEHMDTMFWVPTTEIEGDNKGFYVEDGKAKPLYDIDDNNSFEQKSMIMNYGACCPPQRDFNIESIDSSL